MPNDKVTSSVDWKIKRAYESTFETGKAVYKDMIEEGMLKRIAEVNPIEACKLRIERYQRLLDEEEAMMEDLKDIERMEKRKAKTQPENIQNPEIEKKRFEKFESKKEIYANQIRTNSQDWTKIASALWLDNANEAKSYVLPKLQEAELLG